MRSATHAAMAAVIALALLVGPAGIVTARAAAAPTGSAAARHGHERFALTGSAVGAPRLEVRATGVLRARGYAKPGRLVSGLRVTALIFRRGSVRLATRSTSARASVPDPRTCRFGEVYRGVFRLHGGTHRYARATGSGRFVIKITGRLVRRHGSCRSRIASARTYMVAWGSMRW